MIKKSTKVFKFGGASVRDAASIRNVGRILESHPSEGLLVVVSAMGKTTNALECVLNLAWQQLDFSKDLIQLKGYHQNVLMELFQPGAPVFDEVEDQFQRLEARLKTKKETDYDRLYDQVVSCGEVISSLILARYLQRSLPVEWFDSREVISTDATFREAKINWSHTERAVTDQVQPLLASKIVVTQGFIGLEENGFTTTLGRDGSDFTAGIYGFCLNAESVTIWKDVPGVMNADPKRLPAAVVFDELPFKEAAEMTYYGASVIHPKTIKPLANKGIPLWVKSFENPQLPGTKITECKVENLPPLIVFKENQCLISCKVTDYTFVDEIQLSRIFSALADLDVKINLMQNSAITFSFCVDYRENKVNRLIERLGAHFEVYYNTGLTLITVKNYDASSYQEYRSKPGLLLEQSSRSTLQVLIKN